MAPFRKDYKEKFGYPPYVHPTVRYCWYVRYTGRSININLYCLTEYISKRDSEVSNEELEVASERKRIYTS